MQDHDGGMLRFWGLSFLFFGLVVAVLASAMDGSSLIYATGLTGVGVMTVIVGSLLTFLSFTFNKKSDSTS